MDGDISVESTVGSGTVFTVALPTLRTEETAPLSAGVAA